MAVKYAPEIAAAKVKKLWWMEQGLMETASGYGSRLRTQFMVQFADSPRWYRVYCICYSNCGSLYVRKNGERLFVSGIDIQDKLHE